MQNNDVEDAKKDCSRLYIYIYKAYGRVQPSFYLDCYDLLRQVEDFWGCVKEFPYLQPTEMAEWFNIAASEPFFLAKIDVCELLCH
jgi:hypothetical protein